MTKVLSAILILMSFGGLSAQASEAPLLCKDLLLLQMNEEEESVSLQSIGLSIKVEKSEAGNYGWAAELKQDNQTITELDVDVATISSDEMEPLDELLPYLAPDIKSEMIKKVRLGNVGVKANQDDSSGVLMYELLDQDLNLLTTIVKFGWSFGVCAK